MDIHTVLSTELESLEPTGFCCKDYEFATATSSDVLQEGNVEVSNKSNEGISHMTGVENSDKFQLEDLERVQKDYVEEICTEAIFPQPASLNRKVLSVSELVQIDVQHPYIPEDDRTFQSSEQSVPLWECDVTDVKAVKRLASVVTKTFQCDAGNKNLECSNSGSLDAQHPYISEDDRTFQSSEQSVPRLECDLTDVKAVKRLASSVTKTFQCDAGSKNLECSNSGSQMSVRCKSSGNLNDYEKDLPRFKSITEIVQDSTFLKTTTDCAGLSISKTHPLVISDMLESSSNDGYELVSTHTCLSLLKCPKLSSLSTASHDGLLDILTTQIPKELSIIHQFKSMHDDENLYVQGFSADRLLSIQNEMSETFTKSYLQMDQDCYITAIKSAEFKSLEALTNQNSALTQMSNTLMGFQDSPGVNELDKFCTDFAEEGWAALDMSIEGKIPNSVTNQNNLFIWKFLPWKKKKDFSRQSAVDSSTQENLQDLSTQNETVDAEDDTAAFVHCCSDSNFEDTMVQACEDTLDDEISAFIAAEGFVLPLRKQDPVLSSEKTLSCEYAHPTTAHAGNLIAKLQNDFIQGNQRVVKVHLDDNSPLAEVCDVFSALPGRLCLGPGNVFHNNLNEFNAN